MPRYSYTNWYIGGHSLGGAMAANYAANHEKLLSGVVLLAAYSTKKLSDSLAVISVYGSEDHVLNMKKLKEGDAYLPDTAVKYVIDGGNHAQFGNYGEQDGDGKALISAEDQQRQTAELIVQNK
jgi:poly(3-hydroxybutyrate) depolymerase